VRTVLGIRESACFKPSEKRAPEAGILFIPILQPLSARLGAKLAVMIALLKQILLLAASRSQGGGRKRRVWREVSFLCVGGGGTRECFFKALLKVNNCSLRGTKALTNGETEDCSD